MRKVHREEEEEGALKHFRKQEKERNQPKKTKLKNKTPRSSLKVSSVRLSFKKRTGGVTEFNIKLKELTVFLLK